jgi:hypothetical protein
MTPKPQRIQLSRAKGWRMPENTVKVARPSPWGNPFVIGSPGVPDAATAKAKHREWLLGCIAEDHPGRVHTLAALEELRGKDVACWCGLDQPCHGDNLLEIAN